MPPSRRGSTAFVPGSIRTTTVSRSLPTQTPLGPVTIIVGPSGIPSAYWNVRTVLRPTGSNRWTWSLASLVTQTPEPSAATAVGASTPMRSATSFVSGPIRTTVSPSSLTTQIPAAGPLPTAKNRGAASAILSSSTEITIGSADGFSGSYRSTRSRSASASQIEPNATTIAFSSWEGNATSTEASAGSTTTTWVSFWLPKPFVIQTAPSPATTPVGMPSVDFPGVTFPEPGSIRVTVELPWLITHTSPSSPIATPVGSSPTPIVSTKAPALGSIRPTEFGSTRTSDPPPPSSTAGMVMATATTTSATDAIISPRGIRRGGGSGGGDGSRLGSMGASRAEAGPASEETSITFTGSASPLKVTSPLSA